MMNAIVYCTTNKVNGKKYIGSHAKNNPNYLGSGKWLKHAIIKHGRDNFIRQTLWEGSKEYRFEMEEYYIDYYSAYESPLFYNMSKKGVGWTPGKKRSEKTKAKMSASLMGNKRNEGKKHNEETIAKISASKTGKKRSEETKVKMSASRTGMKYNKHGK